ncbi:unnamed protein product [Polarella glacialis]|uniref:Cystathionine beta-lyase n=1 Tax=Polarella glacialis TaxID=89957 RepID=A0A813JFA6_POLGL|nr:unnamed protein product [Polarella glacialis]
MHEVKQLTANRLWRRDCDVVAFHTATTATATTTITTITTATTTTTTTQALPVDECSSEEAVAELQSDYLERVRGTIGERVDWSQVKFPQAELSCRYDDLPTFPIRPSFAGFENALRPASQCVVFDGCPEDPYHPSNTPIYQTSTFVQPSASEFGAYDYTRSGNPTRTALEKHVAMLEQAAAAFAFASGMAALHTTMRLLRQGDEILVNEDIYGGMHRLLTQDCVHSGVQVRFVDTTDLDSVRKAISPRTKLIHTESPSNPRMRITDLKALADLAHEHGVLLSVDSTMMPPVICKPLLLGVDIVVHSATKFFSGHADCTGGLVCVRNAELAHRIAFLQNAEGTALAPFECFLFLRGIKTMWLRVTRAQENAQQDPSFSELGARSSAQLYDRCGQELWAEQREHWLSTASPIKDLNAMVAFSLRECIAFLLAFILHHNIVPDNVTYIWSAVGLAESGSPSVNGALARLDTEKFGGSSSSIAGSDSIIPGELPMPQLSTEDRLNLRGCLSATQHPYPRLRRKMPLQQVVRCAAELWGMEGTSSDHEESPVARLAQAARLGTQDLIGKTMTLGTNLASWGQGLFVRERSPVSHGRKDSALLNSLRNRGGIRISTADASVTAVPEAPSRESTMVAELLVSAS